MLKNSSRLVLIFLIVIAIRALASGQSATPVTINFDELQHGIRVTDQYLPRVYFSATNFFRGAGGPFGWDLYAKAYPSPFSVNNSITGIFNQCNCFSGNFDTYLIYRSGEQPQVQHSELSLLL